jgi:hypothetical protein
MPETAVNEDRNTPAFEVEVRAPSYQLGVQLPSNDSGPYKGKPESLLSGQISLTANGAHHARSRFRGSKTVPPENGAEPLLHPQTPSS